MHGGAGVCVFLDNIRIKVEKDADPLTIERARGFPVAFINRPEIKITLQVRVPGLAKEWPDPIYGFSLAARENDERHGCVPLGVFPLTVNRFRVAQRKSNRFRI